MLLMPMIISARDYVSKHHIDHDRNYRDVTVSHIGLFQPSNCLWSVCVCYLP
jgi:hypothetical protein